MNHERKYPLMDPKIDFAFKQIFAGKSKESKIALIDLLNAILELQGEHQITEIDYLNPYTDKEYEDDKQSIMDIKVKTQDDEYIDIEIQIRNSDNYRKRSLYYWSTLYGEQIVEGEAYDELKKCVVINILNFNLLVETNDYHSKFKMIEEKQNFTLVDDAEIHYLELKKFAGKNNLDELSTLEQWILFIRDASDETKQALIEQIKKRNEVINMAGEILNRVSQDEKARAIYQQRRKWYLDKVSSEKYMFKQGVESEKVNMAKELIRKGMDEVFIQDVTKLSLSEIEAIKKDMTN